MSKEITFESFQELMQKGGFDPSDVAKFAAMMKSGIVPEVNTKKSKDISFEITSKSYPDFSITKTTPTQTKVLYISPSCNGYFIRIKNRKGIWETESLNDKSYQNFIQGFKPEDIDLGDDFWIKTLPTGSYGLEYLMEYLNIDGILEMIKYKCAPRYSHEYFKSYYYGGPENNIREQARIYQAIPILYREYHNSNNKNIKYLIKENPSIIYTVMKRWGLDKARDFLETVRTSLLEFSGGYYTSSTTFYMGMIGDYHETHESFINSPFYIDQAKNNLPFNPQNSNIPFIEMNYNIFRDYILSINSRRMGYCKYSEIMRDLNDTYKQQLMLYGKVKEKYPKHLLEYHAALSINVETKRTLINEEKFKAQSEVASKYYWKMDKDEGKYVFLYPENSGDIIDEATQQSNCLKTYIDKFQNGECIIIFMRTKDKPDESLVSIEIVDGKIVQAKQYMNHKITHEQENAIEKFAKKFKLEIQSY